MKQSIKIKKKQQALISHEWHEFSMDDGLTA